MKVNETSEELQNLILKYYDFERSNPLEEEQVLLTLNMDLWNVRYELTQNYHYDSVKDKKLSMDIQRRIESIGI
tara:strand:+ start:304 stop:525 length:222 start_codon:yes stop_codon:yes gene_type:complete